MKKNIFKNYEVMKNSNFITTISSELKIGSDLIISANTNQKEIVIGILDINETPIFDIDNAYNKHTIISKITISSYNKFGDIVYTREYDNCKITGYYHSDLNVHNEEDGVIYITLSYEEYKLY